MEAILLRYRTFEGQILKGLKNNGIFHRSNASSGLWLGCLIGLSAIITLLKEDNSYSEICLITGVTGYGLLVSCLCLYIKLSMEKVAVKDFQVIYFLPAIVTSVLYLLIANKGLLVSAAWGLCVGTLGTWGILQLMSYFPGCFTIGEGVAVIHGFILFLVSAFTNLPLRYHLPPIHEDDISTVLLQVGIFYVVSICLLCRLCPTLRQPKYFYSTVVSILTFIAIPVLYTLLDQNPLIWISSFILDNYNRVLLIIYWIVCLTLSTIIVIYQTRLNAEVSSATRKYFHILATLVYVPGLIYDSSLLYFATGIMMALFIFLELIRVLNIPPLGDVLQQAFTVFADEKDVLVPLTPFYLHLGLSFPLWMPTNNLHLLQLLSGVLTIGIGDTAASIIGKKWGTLKWANSEKTVEGTVACIFSQLAFVCGLLCLGYVDRWWLLRSVLAITGVSLVEACTDQIDNLALPFLMYICLSMYLF